MSNYRDISKMTTYDLFLEQYLIILRLLKDLVNTNDLDHAKFLRYDLTDRINYITKLKIKLIERKDIY